MTKQEWPQHGPDYNAWEGDLPAFAALLNRVDELRSGWWTMDPPLKYLTLRIDTRDRGFVLYDRDQNRISPDRVVKAIEKWEAFLSPKDPTNEHGSTRHQGNARQAPRDVLRAGRQQA